jgi:hypothetical protein
MFAQFNAENDEKEEEPAGFKMLEGRGRAD